MATTQTSAITTLGSNLSLQGDQSWTLGSGGTLTVSGTVTRNIGSRFNFSTAGTFDGSGLENVLGGKFQRLGYLRRQHLGR